MFEQKQKETLPPGTRWIMGDRDLPQRREYGQFAVAKQDGSQTVIVLRKRRRQVLEALMRSPLYCASPVRLSDVVFVLKGEYGLAIETEYFEDDSGPVPTRFGVYTLTDQVRYMGEPFTAVEAAE